MILSLIHDSGKSADDRKQEMQVDNETIPLSYSGI